MRRNPLRGNPANFTVQPFAKPRTGKPTFAPPHAVQGVLQNGLGSPCDRTLRTWQCGSSPATTDHRRSNSAPAAGVIERADQPGRQPAVQLLEPVI